jgi:DNA modification methylase
MRFLKTKRKKYVDEHWDFRTSDTRTYTHCYHNYPAVMIPMVCGTLIDRYGKDARTLFDPYCGTGTSLVEANLRGIDAIGFDINPLAELISKAKSTVINPQVLDLYLKDFNELLFSLRFGIDHSESVVVPTFPNIDYWFSKNVLINLSLIKKFIDAIEDEGVKLFFNVAFSETIRESSFTRNNEFKLFRMPQEKMNKFNPDVYSIIESKLYRNRNGLVSYINAKKNDSTAKVYHLNTVYNIPKEVVPDESVDIIVTSPPYGDSRTTVAYGQFSRLANQWLGFENPNQVDRELMGGKITGERQELPSIHYSKALAEITKVDGLRSKDVVSFYNDYYCSITNVARVVKKGKYACYVVGNRRVKGVTLPTDEITADFFENNGFKHVETIIRNIPNKRMPSKNSPSNVTGVSDTTMRNEFIVVMKKL